MFDVEIFNMLGSQFFKEAAVINSLFVDARNYLTGMYIVRIIDQKGVRMKKFIKN